MAPTPLFEDVFRANRGRLVQLGYLLTGSWEAAEDIVQDVFLESRDRLAQVEHPPSYLHRAVANRCRTYHTRNRRTHEVSIALGQASQAALAADLDFHAELLSLPYRQRAAIVLRYFYGLPDTESAVALNCSPSTVRSSIHRGLKRLRKVIDDD